MMEPSASDQPALLPHDAFLGMVSHELRTPMTAIKGTLSLLASDMLGELSEPGKQMVAVALASSDRMITLIDDWLEWQRIEAGLLSLNPAPCALEALAVQAREQVRAQAAARGVRIRLAGESAIAPVDAERLVRVLARLLDNAIKFSPDAAEVVLSLGEHPEGWCFEVRDHGRGVAPERLERLFERREPAEAIAAGPGLGLSISRAVVEGHGGRLWAENHPEDGCSFYLLLPHDRT